MVSSTDLIKSHYEFSMAIGTSLDLKKMLRASIKSLLKILNTPMGVVLFHEEAPDGAFKFLEVFSIPHETSRVVEYQNTLRFIPETMEKLQLSKFKSSLPLHGESGEGNIFYIVDLPDLGILVLPKTRNELDPLTIKSLSPLLTKLAVACKACLQNEELLDHRNNLQLKVHDLVEKRTAELKEAKQVAEALARTDTLTGLNNRRYFFEQSEVELKRAQRYGHRLSVIMLDIDYFKKINDTHGHAAGDEALKVVAKLIDGLAREIDIVARIGGEEFAIILPETDGEAAALLAERLRSALADTVFDLNGVTVSLMASFGVVEANVDRETSFDAILAQADAALYQAKQEGRNLVVKATG